MTSAFWQGTDLLGWLAVAITILAYAQRTMLPLRVVATAGNGLFALFGLTIGQTPMIVLNLVLFLFNGYRLIELWRLRHRSESQHPHDASLAWAAPMLSFRKVADGEVIFARGDYAQALYYIRSGNVLIEEAGVTLGPGAFFGEMAFFTPEGARTATARAIGACDIALLTEKDFTAAFYQSPDFSLLMARLIAARLSDDRAEPEAAG